MSTNPAPTVSIIVPCYNEQATIRLLLEAILVQSYPRSKMSVIIADGMSSDRTRGEIEAFKVLHPDLEIAIIDNERRIIPAALNRALHAARGEIIVRLDAHSVPRLDYVERCVTALQQGLGENVGGVWEIVPGASGWPARSIAAAAAHPFGVGDARYRYTDHAGQVDTVPFGAFRKDIIQRIGPFDEKLLSNEDYEFNVRIRQSGGVVWLDPKIRSVYIARSNFGDLARQYWRYGFWKLRMLISYPESLRWRQALPPIFVTGLLLGLLVCLFFPVLWRVYLLLVSVYTLLLFLGGLNTAIQRKEFSFAVGVPLAIAMMHISWGSGFLWSLLSFFFSKLSKKKSG